MVGQTFIATTATERRLAMTLAIDLVTLHRVRALRVAITRLASLAAHQVPVILGTSVARLALDVRQTRTLATGLVAKSRSLIGAQMMTHTLGAILLESIAKVARCAHLARRSGRVVQTLETFARLLVAAARRRHVDVVVALALQTLATRNGRVAIVIVLATITPFAHIARLTMAQHILGARIQFTGLGVRHARAFDARTRTLATAHRPLAADFAQRIAIEATGTLVAMLPRSVLATIDTRARLRVAQIGEAVTPATLTGRVIPVARLALVTLSAVGARAAITLATGLVAEAIDRTIAIAITRPTSFGSEAIIANVTAAAYTFGHIRLARTIATELGTHLRTRTGRVAIASCHKEDD